MKLLDYLEFEKGEEGWPWVVCVLEKGQVTLREYGGLRGQLGVDRSRIILKVGVGEKGGRG